jgi:collagenase-like PrtC family protease
MKSVNYVAGVVKAYREAIDAYAGDPKTTVSTRPGWKR